MTSDPPRLPDISAYLDLLDRFIEHGITAPQFEGSFLRTMKAERRVLGEPIYPILQQLFEETEAYVERPELRTEPEDLDDEQLHQRVSGTRQALRDIGFD